MLYWSCAFFACCFLVLFPLPRLLLFVFAFVFPFFVWSGLYSYFHDIPHFHVFCPMFLDILPQAGTE